MGLSVEEYKTYVIENKSLVLATVGADLQPNIRHIGGYGLDGIDIVFGTGATTQKVGEIANNPKAAAVFQHENQSVLKNITVYGSLEKIAESEIDAQVENIHNRRPQFQYVPGNSVLYRFRVEKIKKLDFSAENKYEEYTREELI